MVEIILLNYLQSTLTVPVFLEKLDNPPAKYVLIEKTGGSITNYIESATVAIQSYAESMYEAAALNETVKAALEEAKALGTISGVRHNSDYNYTDTTTKVYRYQALYDITFYKET